MINRNYHYGTAAASIETSPRVIAVWADDYLVALDMHKYTKHAVGEFHHMDRAGNDTIYYVIA